MGALLLALAKSIYYQIHANQFFTICLPWAMVMYMYKRAYKKACRSGKAVHLTKYKRLRNITTKCLCVDHDKYLNDVMGGLTPASLMMALMESNVLGRT